MAGSYHETEVGVQVCHELTGGATMKARSQEEVDTKAHQDGTRKLVRGRRRYTRTRTEAKVKTRSQ